MSRKRTIEKIIADVEVCCALNDWTQSGFGRKFNGDPSFVRELRGSLEVGKPRKLHMKTKLRLRAFLIENGVMAPSGV